MQTYTFLNKTCILKLFHFIYIFLYFHLYLLKFGKISELISLIITLIGEKFHIFFILMKGLEKKLLIKIISILQVFI